MAGRALYDRPGDESIIRVRIPLPFPLRWVNSYVLPDAAGTGWSLIDPGLNTPEARSLWDQILSELGLAVDRLSQVVLTHHHPDHYGLAGWFQEKSGAPVFLSPEGRRQTERLWRGDAPLTEETLRLFERHGLAKAKLPELRDHLDSFIPQVSPQPTITELGAGEMIRMGGWEWEAIHTPGHAFGHLCFYQVEEQLLFAGDHVLPRISPNISYIPGEDANPLDSYLKALQDIAERPVRLVYPGHRDPFANLAERAGELILHHEERLRKMTAMMDEPKTAYELSEAYFGRELTIHTLRFALSETIAHLNYLEAQGNVRKEERAGKLIYHAAKART
ncbi:MBL fold metallo-hydrolase [Gorillibacterium timonense]|uniref:MBL fold metallo-hydrolase n=1 Tax=Gorillibacterium timonense TaxID=1689269 RepID=UPI00071C6EA8|nr:MBL fold metallo-hydrolase [Gorillibacterium timonense]